MNANFESTIELLMMFVCLFFPPKVYHLINLFIFVSEACKILVPQPGLEPRYPVVEVKWAIGSITTNRARGGDGIPAELLQILIDGAIKVLYSACQQI